MNKPQGQGLFGPQIWQTISLDPELRPFMNDKDFVQKVNMLNANPQMAMQMGVLNDPKIKKVFEKMMGMSFGGGDDHKEADSPMKGSCCDDAACSEKEDVKREPTPEPEPEPEVELTEEEKKQREEEEKEREAQRQREAEALKHKEAGNALYKEKKW